MFKRCNVCGIDKLLIEMCKDKLSKDGYRFKCKLCRKNEFKIYYNGNKEKRSLQNKEYRINNKIILRKKSAEYSEANKDKRRNYEKVKKQTDSNYKLKAVIRTSVSRSIRKLGFSKHEKTRNILECSFEYFKAHIESKFEPWMNWDNYGKFNGYPNHGWDIDHVLPLSSAKTEKDILKLNHYTNLQPLCSYINRIIKKDTTL